MIFDITVIISLIGLIYLDAEYGAVKELLTSEEGGFDIITFGIVLMIIIIPFLNLIFTGLLLKEAKDNEIK